MQVIASPGMFAEREDAHPSVAAVRLLEEHGTAAPILARAGIETARGRSDDAAERFWAEVLASVQRMAAADRDIEFLSA